MNEADYVHAANVGQGMLCIRVGQVLGHLRTAVDTDSLDRYVVACAAVQFWADMLASSKPGSGAADLTATAKIERELQRAERQVDNAALALLGHEAPISEMSDDLAFARIGLTVDSRLAFLNKLIHLPMPECLGYDLADLELIRGDAERFVEQIGIDRPVLIVGVRTGGTYLAPLWKVALRALDVADSHWCTVRPPMEHLAFDGLTNAQAWLQHRWAPVVVVVDDRPDTGATMERVAAVLRAPGIDLWFASVGRLWRGAAGLPAHSRSSKPAVSVRCDSRLWECLLADAHPRFISRLRTIHGLPALPTHIQLQFRCPQAETSYGFGRPWLPWNDPNVLNGRRSLVNPRKTPISVGGPNGRTLLHLRFIGESVFGRAEFLRVQKLSPARAAWFIDGYVITVDIGAARPFRDVFRVASSSLRSDLLSQAASWLTIFTRQVIAHACSSPVAIALGHRWSELIDAMQERCGLLLAVPGPLRALLERHVPWPGQTGKVIRSSLRYACGSWHWQIDNQGRLHRFQLEANWGDASFPELEAAAFALENRLPLADARRLTSLCGLNYSSVRESLSLAALMIAESRLRVVTTLSDRGRIALCRDFHQLLASISELAELDAFQGG